MFTSRIITSDTTNPEVEDIYSSALALIAPDDTQNSHGIPGSYVTYISPQFGKIILQIPIHPDVEDGRKLFAHYLWNAGIIAADAIECSSNTTENFMKGDDQKQLFKWNQKYWNVRGKKVMELGAGTALPSIISTLSGATSVNITDHPSSPAITSGTIEENVKRNLSGKISGTSSGTNDSDQMKDIVNIYGYTWGTQTMYSPENYGKPASNQPEKIDRLIIADCLWMASQHENLVKTIIDFLDEGEPESYALIIAGFHTGRGIVRAFFEVVEESKTLVETPELTEAIQKQDSGKNTSPRAVYLEIAEIFEIDVDGNRRDWQPSRQQETKYEAKRWCVCAVLRKQTRNRSDVQT